MLETSDVFRSMFGVLLATAMLLGGGCQKNWQAKTVPATGRVRVNGEYPKGAIIQLFAAGTPPDRRNSRPYGFVDERGTYQLSTYKPNDGVPPGEYIFTIRWPWNPNSASYEDRLDHAFDTPQKSKLRVTITEGMNELPEMELENVKVLDKSPARDAAPVAP